MTGPRPSRLGSYFFFPFLFFFLLFLAMLITPFPVRDVNDLLTEASTYH